MIALAEISLLVEAVLLFFLLSRKTHEPLRVGRPLALSFLASAVGGALAYFIAVYLPGGAISTALIGIAAGGLAALAIVWSEVKLLFRL